MRVWFLDDLAGLDRLRLADAPDPVARNDEVILEVHSSGESVWGE